MRTVNIELSEKEIDFEKLAEVFVTDFFMRSSVSECDEKIKNVS